MRRYDPDLIAALAEGTLEPDEAARVEREIAADPTAAAELAAQRAALAFLGAIEAPRLTAAERSDLESAVAGALGLEAPDAVVHHAPRRIPWGSLGIAAAALAGLVAIVPVVGLLSTGGSDDASFELAAEAPVSTADAGARSAAADAAAPVADTADEFAAGETPTLGFDSATTVVTPVAPGSESSLLEAPTSTTVGTTTTTSTSTTSTTTTAAPATTVSALDRLMAELTALHGDPNALKTMSRTADSTTSCWSQDTATRPTPPPTRSVFDYDNGDYTVIVYYVLTGGTPGPFHVWGIPACEDIGVVG